MKSTLFCIAIILILSAFRAKHDLADSYNNFASPPPDTLLFQPNERDDWQCLQTYVVMSPDSIVTVELILLRNPSGRVDWTEPSVIGRFNKDFAPNVRVDTLVKQPSRTWKVAISEKGKCMIKLVKGDPPRRRDGFVIPIKMKYKI